MVRAILGGSKTQTRRPIKPQPEPIPVDIRSRRDKCDHWWPCAKAGAMIDITDAAWLCPFGKVGDQIWVRENFQPLIRDESERDYKTGAGYRVVYPATDPVEEFYDAFREDLSNRVWPSIHMPRWASRITLEITNVRVERVMDISEADAKAEGSELLRWFHRPGTPEGEDTNLGAQGQQWNESWDAPCYRNGFAKLWQSIYVGTSNDWDRNPWVWALEFRRVEK